MQNSTKIIFAIFFINITLQARGIKKPAAPLTLKEQPCDVNQELVDNLNAKYNMNSLKIDDFVCKVQTKLSKNAKNQTVVKKTYNLDVKGCANKVEVVMVNSQGKSVNDCTEDCLNPFDVCLTKQEQPEQKEEVETHEHNHHHDYHNHDHPSHENSSDSHPSHNHESHVHESHHSHSHYKHSSFKQEDKKSTSSLHLFSSTESEEEVREEPIQLPTIEPVSEEVHMEAQEHKEHLLGASNECNQEQRQILKEVVSEFEASGLLTIPMIYDENVVVCYHQLVNMNFIQSILRIDGVECKMFFNQDATLNVTISDKHATKLTDHIMPQDRLLNDRLKDFDHLEDCGRTFHTKRYMLRVQEAKQE